MTRPQLQEHLPLHAASASGARKRGARRWKHSWLNTAMTCLLVTGLTLLTYPTAAAWVTQKNQSNIVYEQSRDNEKLAQETLDRMISSAEAYNDALISGAVYQAGSNKADGTGDVGTLGVTADDYWNILDAQPRGLLARLKIPRIDADLPVYHGTSDSTLLKGIGHLQGTSLPVGGAGTRSVLTGHRGLANATMFTSLDQVGVGDLITVEVLDRVFTYRVFETKVVNPDETEAIRAVPGKDLLTLVTCTPIGINTHRILVTGERVDPTPQSELDAAGARPEVPGFPWWIVIYLSGLAVTGLWQWRSGYTQLKPPQPTR